MPWQAMSVVGMDNVAITMELIDMEIEILEMLTNLE
jgi:hypothetical protein